LSDRWLDICRAAMVDTVGVLLALPTRAEREPVVGAGLGGDDTTAIDAAVERAVIDRFDALVDDYTIVSEEIGEVVKGNGTPRIVLDPIDGSLNAKRGLPHFALSVAVAEGETMDDVVFGYVFDFGSREEWTAHRGGGAWLNGEALGRERPKDRIEILAFEATLTSAIAERAAHVVGLAYRLRIMGSLAIALCNLAAGRLDGVCSLKPARSVDIAAAQLLVREVGLAIELFELPSFGESPLDLGAHSRLAAAATPELVAELAAALQA
jgi:myo-inositol-1(or 4)-monophosphatase